MTKEILTILSIILALLGIFCSGMAIYYARKASKQWKALSDNLKKPR